VALTTASFSVSQSVGLEDTLTLTDTSTGSDAAIVSRVAYLQKSDGTFLVESGVTTDYNAWAYADSSIALAVLDKDYALKITVEWLDINDAVLYSEYGYYGLTAYNEDFDYTLTTILASNPILVNDNSFRENKSKLRLYIDSGDKAITRSSDITSAQLCYNEATKIRIGSVYFFNESTS